MPAPPWAVRAFRRHPQDDEYETNPSAEYLSTCPEGTRADLVAIVDAVAASPPPSFTGGGMWEAMHGEMAGVYEARARGPKRRLYRLFCVLEREAPGLDGPTVVVITGADKKVGEAFSKAEYAHIRALVDEYRRRTPRRAFA